MPPETRYAKSGDVNIAYQVVGDGPFDLVYVPGWVSNVDLLWERPKPARFLERLASFSRLIMFDKRGTGMSDRVSNDRLPTLEQRMDDVRAVLDAVGSENAALLGHSEGCSMSVLFAATYPERSSALVLAGSFAKRVRTDDYPWAPSLEERLQTLHTGECQLMRDKIGGIAVHTGARVAAAAEPGEVLVSSTVKDLVAGSGIVFADRGERELKGVGSWRLYSVLDA
jgi:pimeloyl-ACP methyl ester carboxylesterase